jgi:predicted nucleotide-binding protein (sugar kinase/HSP70/actin superfamily)
MITIGLPKGLFYFEHHILWKQFFKNINCKVVVSQDTNKEILDYGVKYCSNETCLPVKVFHGHVYSLKDLVDYIFIPRYTSLDKNEYTCPKFCGLPDMAALCLKRQVKVLEVRVHIDLLPSETYNSLLELSRVLHLKDTLVLEAFKDACRVYTEDRRIKHEHCTYTASISNSKIAVSVLGHPYMIYDSYLNMKLLDKLRKRNIAVYTPRDIDHKTKRENAYPFQEKVFWEVGFELLGSAYTFAEDPKIKGLIYLTPFACGIDAFILEFIERRIKAGYDVPLLKLTIDEHTGEAGFDTRLEAFLDMVG